MWTSDDIVDAIRHEPAAAEKALASMPWNGLKPLTPDSLELVATTLGDDVARTWVDQLEKRDLLTAFGNALLGLGVELEEAAPPDGFEWDDHLDPLETSRFLRRASTARCRVFVNGAYSGTGCLVGPGLVLTAWHVIAVAGPSSPQEPAPQIRVQLTDGKTLDAAVPPQFSSPCSDDEFAKRAPRADADVAGGHDIALLKLTSPAARHLGYARLPRPAPSAAYRGSVLVAHFPEGNDPGLGSGRASKIRNVTARLRHDVTTLPGSSGGACFDNQTRLLGVHQGVWDEHGLLIPIERFIDGVATHVDLDIAPRQLWRLDEAASNLVVGRDLFAEAVAAASEEATRVRGVWVKRTSTTTNQPGLGYSLEILRELLLRRGPEQVVVPLPHDSVGPDLFAEIRRRVTTAGIALPAPVTPEGSAAGEAAPEATARATANLLALAVNGAAAASGQTVWFFVENPTVAVAEDSRLALEAFVAAMLTQPRVRLVVAGLETFQLAGLQFPNPAAAAGEGAPGLVVEYVGSFRREDLLNLLTQASEELTGTADQAEIGLAADQALLPLQTNVNGAFDMDKVAEVLPALRTTIEVFRQRGMARQP